MMNQHQETVSIAGTLPETELASRSAKPRWRLFWALALFVSLSSALAIFPRIYTTPFHGDESDWVSAGYYYTGLLIDGDFNWRKWACAECGPYGKINLHLGKWMMGAPLLLDPATRSRPYIAHYNFDESVEYNRLHGTLPSPDILIRARTAPALFGVLCCFMLFAIGFWTFNAWVGLIAAALLLGNSLFLILTSQAMTDTFYNFFLLSGCLTLVALSKATSRKLTLWLVVICALIAALACSVKITGILLVGAIFTLTVVYRFYFVRRIKIKELALMFALFGVVSVGTVYALNPVFWPSWGAVRVGPLVQEVRTFPGEVIAKRASLDHDGITALAGRYPQLRNLANPAEFPILFLRWSHSMERQLYRADWHGNRVVSVHAALFSLGPPLQSPTSVTMSVTVVGLFYAVLAGVGVFLVLSPRGPAILASRRDAYVVPLFYLLVNYMLIVLFLKLNWNRYYLPTIIAMDLLVAVGLYGTVRLVREFLLTRSSSTVAFSTAGAPRI